MPAFHRNYDSSLPHLLSLEGEPKLQKQKLQTELTESKTEIHQVKDQLQQTGEQLQQTKDKLQQAEEEKNNFFTPSL